MQLTQRTVSNQIVTDAFTGLAETRIATPSLVAQYAPGHLSPGGATGWATERRGGGVEGLERKHESP
jgi:hypothetical protein